MQLFKAHGRAPSTNWITLQTERSLQLDRVDMGAAGRLEGLLILPQHSTPSFATILPNHSTASSSNQVTPWQKKLGERSRRKPALDTWASWEDIVTLRRELDEARRHIEKLLWEVEELIEQEIDSIKEYN